MKPEPIPTHDKYIGLILLREVIPRSLPGSVTLFDVLLRLHVYDMIVSILYHNIIYVPRRFDAYPKDLICNGTYLIVTHPSHVQRSDGILVKYPRFGGRASTLTH